MKHEEFINKVFTADEVQFIKGARLLVALSGGADSVALLRVLLEAGCDCHAAHCNFHLRGEESMRDEQFVRDLCRRLNVPLSVTDFDVTAWQQEHGGSVEMACRELRYAWFEQQRDQQGCSRIAIAHHADDQVETFFLNLLRGTGVKGLSGMQRLSGYIWRPLLGISRDEIIDYLTAIGQDYVTDSTNAENDYRRNRLRNIVLPVVDEQFKESRARILDTMDNLSCDNDLLDELVNQVLPNYRHIDIEQLSSHVHAPTLLYHRIRHLGFNHEQCAQAVQAAREGHTGRQFHGYNDLLVVNRHSLDISPSDMQQDIEVPLDLTTDIKAPVAITVTRGRVPFSPTLCDGKRVVAFNTQLLNCRRIVLRHWRRGDRMKPFGLKGSKLLSDLFADFKLNHNDKQTVWILEADGEIIWVLGYRSSALYPVQRGSQDYLLLAL